VERPVWTPDHRRAANRSGLRYPSDLTDAEWAIVEPMIPPARHGGRKRSVNVREVLNGIFYVLWTGCQWQALPKDLPPKSRCTTISNCGTGTARLSAFITRFTWRCVSRKDMKRARRPPSSTRRRRKEPRKAGFARSCRLRRGQEDQGSQAAHPGRHVGPPAERRRSSRQRSGPRRRSRTAAHGTPLVPLHRARLRRCRLPGSKDGEGRRRHGLLGHRDR